MPLAGQLTVVLHQTRSPDNLGAVARVMANFGFSHLVLSEPATYAFRGAERLAVRGEAVLARMAVAPTLAEALGPCVWAVGTTSRAQLKGRVALSPEEAVQKLAEQSARGPVALVFGGEKRGLSDDELGLCQDVLAIPTHAAQPSMNLAQSAAVLLYLCSRAGAPPPAGSPPEPGARLGTVEALRRLLDGTLLEAGFLNPQAPEHVRRELERSLLRGALTQREAELWLGAFKQLQRAMKKGAGP